MIERLDYYDLLGNLVPGTLLVGWVPICFPGVVSAASNTAFPEAFSVIALVVLTFFLGQLIQAVGSIIEPALHRSWGGRPSDNALKGTLGGKFPAATATRVRNRLIEAVGREADDHSLFLFAMQRAAAVSTSRAGRFNSLYAYHRAMLVVVAVATLLLVASLLWGAAAAWSGGAVVGTFGLMIALAGLTWHRTKQRGIYFVREVLLVAEQTLEPINLSPKEVQNGEVESRACILWPTDPDILVRTAILHVGQGASALVFMRDGSGYKTLLVDINLDAGADGIDVRSLVEDLVGDDGLDVFVNTHPHDDHLRGIKDLADRVDIREVWHSGHKPNRKYGSTYYDELVPVINKVVKTHGAGAERILEGSREEQALGDANYYVLSPAKYVTDDVNDETPETRRARIHEQCGVLKFGTAGAWSMIVGDADRDAFEKHIQEYHKERLPAKLLAASHHGSRTFFCCEEGDDPYKDALDSIDPDYVVVSAPRQKESRHCHPHDDAMKIYREKVGKDNVLHTGKDRYSFICDIYADGTYGGMEDDMGELAARYPLKDDDGGGNGSANSNGARVAAVSSTSRTRIDDRPMGAAS